MYEKTNFACFDDAKVRRGFGPGKFIQRIPQIIQQKRKGQVLKWLHLTQKNRIFYPFILYFARFLLFLQQKWN